MVGTNGNAHLFVARWPISAKFRPGWYTHCEIARYVGKQPEGPFAFQEVVLKGTGKSSWDKVAPHNPTIEKVGNQYALLYIARAGKGFHASQQIGMVISKDLNGPWSKVGQDGLILSPPDDPAVWSRNSPIGVTNPTLIQHPDGRFLLYYKAIKKGDIPRMGVAIADRLKGPYVHHKEPVTNNPRPLEDGHAFVENGRIHLLTKDSQRGGGLLWSSDDGIHFSEPSLGYARMEQYIPAEEVEAATDHKERLFERPQVLIQDGRPTHLYVASGVNIRKGDGSCSYVLRIRQQEGNEPDAGDGT